MNVKNAYRYLIVVLVVFSSCKKDNTTPVADFLISPEEGNTATIFTLDAGLSHDNEDKTTDLEIRWDWNNDNIADTGWSFEKIVRVSYSIASEYIITLDVRDKSGLIGTLSKNLIVNNYNKPPEIPQYVRPGFNSNDNDIVLMLEWLCYDYENNSLTYDVYLGADTDPRLLEADWPDKYYQTDTLLSGTNYYWKIVARDDYGKKTEGPLWFFITKGDTVNSFIDLRDGRAYKTIKMGSQWWMAENLNYIISNGSVCYNLNSDICEKFGRLYDWEAAVLACPPGWHLPSDDEWKDLEESLGMHEDAADAYGLRGIDEGQKLKTTAEWINNGNGTNESGFSALPSGQRGFIADFTSLGESASFWTSSYFSDWESWSRELYYDKNGIYRTNYHHKLAFSVRCVKN